MTEKRICKWCEESVWPPFDRQYPMGFHGQLTHRSLPMRTLHRVAVFLLIRWYAVRDAIEEKA